MKIDLVWRSYIAKFPSPGFRDVAYIVTATSNRCKTTPKTPNTKTTERQLAAKHVAPMSHVHIPPLIIAHLALRRLSSFLATAWYENLQHCSVCNNFYMRFSGEAGRDGLPGLDGRDTKGREGTPGPPGNRGFDGRPGGKGATGKSQMYWCFWICWTG